MVEYQNQVFKLNHLSTTNPILTCFELFSKLLSHHCQCTRPSGSLAVCNYSHFHHRPWLELVFKQKCFGSIIAVTSFQHNLMHKME